MFEKIKKKMFGPKENFAGVSKKSIEEIANQFDWQTLSTFLPYQAYDEESEIFINRNSVGFVIESLPLTGADEFIQKEITNIFQDEMEEGSSVQFLLLADHRTEGFLNRWRESHSSKDGASCKIHNLAIF